MTVPNDSLRKAAILVATLDHVSADALLAHLSPEQARRVRRAAVELGPIDTVEQENVITQFMRVGPLMPIPQPAGIELDASLAARLGAQTTSTPHRGPHQQQPHSTAARDDIPFRFLHEAESDELVHFLEREHPQTVAVVLAHLSPDHAASLIADLDHDLRTDVLRRLAYLDRADPETVREIERGLESWLHRHVSDRVLQSGVGAVSKILKAAGGEVERGVLSRLAGQDERLAETLRRRATPELSPLESQQTEIISFDELATWASAALGRLLAASEREVLVLALAGAKPEFVERVFAVLPSDLADSLARELGHLGPTPLRDIELAQSELARLAAELQSHAPRLKPAMIETL